MVQVTKTNDKHAQCHFCGAEDKKVLLDVSTDGKSPRMVITACEQCLLDIAIKASSIVTKGT